MDLPSDIVIGGSIKQGVVYYFREGSFDSEDSHFFVVLNRNATTDSFIYFVNATSQVDKAKFRIEKQKLPPETLVIIGPSECSILTKLSAFDCNSVTKKHVSELLRLVEEEALVIKGEMPKECLDKLVSATKKSPLVENRAKKKI